MVSSPITAATILAFAAAVMNTAGSTPAPVAVGEDTPTISPVEFSNRTIYNDGDVYIISDDASSFDHETVIVTDNSTLLMQGGYIIAPANSEGWPAVRLSIGGVINGTGGTITGSVGTGDDDGGEAIEMFNGQSSPDTASFGYFWEGIEVFGGDAPNGGVGGTALHGEYFYSL